MKFNLTSIVNNSLRYLKIANKSIPLIRQIKPTFNTIKSQLNKTKKENIIIKKKNIKTQNSLTFFK